MAECKDCFHYNACSTIFEESLGLPLPCGKHNADRCNDFIQAADVVPKSEVERLQKALDAYEETSGLKQAKAEIAREIFEEIENFIPRFMVGYFSYESLTEGIAEIKKKYTGDET